jgi:hypothetical protein
MSSSDQIQHPAPCRAGASDAVPSGQQTTAHSLQESARLRAPWPAAARGEIRARAPAARSLALRAAVPGQPVPAGDRLAAGIFKAIMVNMVKVVTPRCRCSCRRHHMRPGDQGSQGGHVLAVPS